MDLIVPALLSAAFSPAVAGNIAEAVRIFEANHLRDRIGEAAAKAAELMDRGGARNAPDHVRPPQVDPKK